MDQISPKNDTPIADIDSHTADSGSRDAGLDNNVADVDIIRDDMDNNHAGPNNNHATSDSAESPEGNLPEIKKYLAIKFSCFKI